MVEKTRRARLRTDEDGDDRGSSRCEWETFVREEPPDPLRHVGRVVAADATEAHDHASRLFGWYAHDVWVCPTDAVARYSVRAAGGAGADRESADVEEVDDGPTDGCESADSRPADAASVDRRPEPRVYEETEGTPRVRDSR